MTNFYQALDAPLSFFDSGYPLAYQDIFQIVSVGGFTYKIHELEDIYLETILFSVDTLLKLYTTPSLPSTVSDSFDLIAPLYVNLI